MADPDPDTGEPRERPKSPQDRAFLSDHPERGHLILVRHGEQEWPEENSPTAAWIDPPLSERGRHQAELVGQFLHREPIAAVYSSHLSRAHDTGRAIGKHHDLEPMVMKELAEIEIFRDLPDDRPATDILGDHILEGVRDRFVRLRKWDAYPMSESSAEFRNRTGLALDAVLARHPDQTVVVACHGGVINAFLAELLTIEMDMFFRPAHTSVHRIRHVGHHRVIESLNETHHLLDESGASHRSE
ncbi:MAG: histidine phosphatase family protein [Actinomycetia bacterium]|nr:histidine phosphatase family protein [Actinomycetes bacterium]